MPLRREGRLVVFGAHLLNADILLGDAIVVQLEQIASPWVSGRAAGVYRSILRDHIVWDFSARNIAVLRSWGCRRVHLCRIGYAPELSCIAPVPVRDIDVLFYGSVSGRRMLMLAAMQRAGVNVKLVAAFGAERDAFIARSKVVLNLHFYPDAAFEIVRCSYLMANRAIVVSEVGADPELEAQAEGGVRFAPYDGLVGAVQDALRGDGESDRDRALATIQRVPQEAEIVRCLDELHGRLTVAVPELPPYTPPRVPFDQLLQTILRDSPEGPTDGSLWRRAPLGNPREDGWDVPKEAETFVGRARLNNVVISLAGAVANDVPGDFLETGAWRGGVPIAACAVLKALGDEDRKVWYSDTAVTYDGDFPRTVPPIGEIDAMFAKYDYCDGRIRLAVTYDDVERLCVLRLGRSTARDIGLLYAKLSVGGICIVDDYLSNEESRKTIDEFRFKNEVTEKMLSVDHDAVWWRKDAP